MESKILVEQELLILPVHPSSPPVFSEYFYLRFYYYHWVQVIWFYFPRIWLSCLGLLVLFPHNLAILFRSSVIWFYFPRIWLSCLSQMILFPQNLAILSYVICHLVLFPQNLAIQSSVICHRSSGFISPEHFCIIRLSKKFQ